MLIHYPPTVQYTHLCFKVSRVQATWRELESCKVSSYFFSSFSRLPPPFTENIYLDTYTFVVCPLQFISFSETSMSTNQSKNVLYPPRLHRLKTLKSVFSKRLQLSLSGHSTVLYSGAMVLVLHTVSSPRILTLDANPVVSALVKVSHSCIESR